MNGTTATASNIWLRGVLMILMAMVYHVSTWLLFLTAFIQFIVTLVNREPNTRLMAFGRGLGNYLRHIAQFESFVTDVAPFPFSDWPKD